MRHHFASITAFKLSKTWLIHSHILHFLHLVIKKVNISKYSSKDKLSRERKLLIKTVLSGILKSLNQTLNLIFSLHCCDKVVQRLIHEQFNPD